LSIENTGARNAKVAPCTIGNLCEFHTNTGVMFQTSRHMQSWIGDNSMSFLYFGIDYAIIIPSKISKFDAVANSFYQVNGYQ